MTKVLVTGGAGFIGSHLVDALVGRGYGVRVLDSLAPQVHGNDADIPSYLRAHVRAGRVEFLREDVRDPDAVAAAVRDVDVVFHHAAAVGVGQSMYRIADYVEVNSLGGAVLLESIVRRSRPLSRLIVASSMSIYGEGSYRCARDGEVSPDLRPAEQLAAHAWQVRCPTCGAEVEPMPTREEKPLRPTSVYAITKRDHEELFLTVGRAYGIPTVALRYFNVYGPRQALNNPYTGVAAIFASRLLKGQPPLVFEDGLQSRDFVHVSDIVRANLLALERGGGGCRAYNVGTGRRLSLLQLAGLLRDRLGGPDPCILSKARKGDIRECYADVSRIRRGLGFEAQVRFGDGIEDLARWARAQKVHDQVDRATAELESLGLTA